MMVGAPHRCHSSLSFNAPRTQDLRDIPRNAVARRVNELVKRARMA